MQRPAGGTVHGSSYTYEANDASVGDLDGDGRYEIVLKWEPTNAKDNSQSGYTGPVLIDAYELDGTLLWRINLGINIRAGAHYTQFQVYDYDGDGRAEVAMKTADGTRDGTGAVIGSANADYRNSSGYVLSGPEYLTVFDGRTGRALDTVDYVPPRGNVSSWGDSYGNRVDRFLAGTAYLDGKRPSMIFSRGYYTRTVITAWDFRDGRLTRRWTFDTNSSTNTGRGYEGQGFHSLSIADADGDGRDEIMFGAMAVDDDGRGMWTTGYGHGDALHVGDFVPARPGLGCTGFPAPHSPTPAPDAHRKHPVAHRLGDDSRRGVAGDIWAGSPARFWSSRVDGLLHASRPPSAANPARSLPRLVGRNPSGTAGPDPDRLIRSERRHARSRATVWPPTTAPKPPRPVRRHPRRLARRGDLADQQLGAADLRQPAPHGTADPTRCMTPSTGWRSPGRTPHTTSRRTVLPHRSGMAPPP